ncbi:small fragment nuclease [Amia ocellicauda]|uniref:small fragment nuclease n=1 Tax=Amia ocellicauda TaxID=2972642 RepID=UPI003463C5D9|nr:ORN protein [Amia calva]
MPASMRAAWSCARTGFGRRLLTPGPAESAPAGTRTLDLPAAAARLCCALYSASAREGKTAGITAGLRCRLSGFDHPPARTFCKMTASPVSVAESMGQRLVWVDLEMTGLDIEKDQIIEMACIITDSDLNVLAEGPNLIINQPDKLLDGMSDWCKEHHGKSGLTQAVRDSKMSLEQAQYEFLSFIRQYTPPGHCPLAGNSVHADKKFLDKYMPQFMRHLHYRIIDVSTIKELCRRWFPEEYKLAPKKKASHRALDDIQESIKELQFYRMNVFKVEMEEKKQKITENGENDQASR